MSFNDADLIARVLAFNDQNAFGELVRRHQSPVRGFLTKMTNGDTHRADDLAQETFVKAWKRISSFRAESKFSTWLLGIAYNEWRMNMRKRTEVSVEDIETELPEESTDATASSSNLRMDLDAAMMTLTTAERAAIVLCCQNEMSHEEAARALDRPVGTVKTNILRGKEKLRRRLCL